MSRRKKPDLSSAVAAVNKKAILLVFAVKNKRHLPSLWSEFYPRSEMRWEWDEKGDQRVADLWHLREELSSSKKVVYAKWFQGRATLISKKLFPLLLSSLNFSMAGEAWQKRSLSPASQKMLKLLEDSSPLSTKELKEMSGLKGKSFEADYHRSLSELWKRLLIVGSGEVDDGAFPSLAISATSLLFEKQWIAAQNLSPLDARKMLEQKLGSSSVFLKYLHRTILQMDAAQERQMEIWKAFKGKPEGLRHDELQS